MNQTENNKQSPLGHTSPPGYGYDPSMINDEDGVDITRYFSLFLSNWYWFAIALFIAFGIAYGINRWSEKVYSVSASMLIEDEEYSGDLSVAEKFIPGGEMFGSRQNLQNEIGILKSFSLNLEAIKLLPDFWVTITGVGKRGIAERRLYKKAPFSVVFDSLAYQIKGSRVDIKIISDEEYKLTIGDSIERIKRFGDQYHDDHFDFTIKKQGGFIFENDRSNKYYFSFNSLEGLANSYRVKLSLSPIGDDASLVTLLSSGFSAEQEADYINKLMKVYIDLGLDLKNVTADSTIAFINDQLDYITDSLTNAESKLESFRLNNSLINLSSEASLLQARAEKYENEKYGIEFEKRYYEYLIDYIELRDESGEIVSPSLVGITDPTLGLLVSELADYQQQKRNVLFSLKDDLPAVKLIDSQISGARKILMENVQNSLKNSTRMLENANARIADVDEGIQKLPGTERELINIQRKFDLNNTVYNYLMEKRAEAGIARASSVADNRIIDKARSFNAFRTHPREKRNYMIALALGLLIPLGLLILIDLLNNKIIDRKDVIKGTKVPVIGLISHNNLKSELPVFQKSRSTLSESFRSVRTSLRYLKKDVKTPVISISSAISSEGKTFVAVNVASVFALSGKRTLLVGLDLRKPRIHKILGSDNSTGLTNYLIGDRGFDDIIQKTEFDNFYYIQSGPVPPNPAELIDSEKMTEFLAKAREEFDYIILDTPPFAIVTDALLLSEQVDVNLFVVRQRYSSKNTLNLIQELYDSDKLKNMGIIINDISISGYYGYGLRYGYSLGYGYNYGYSYYGAYSNGKYGSKYYEN